MSSVAGVRRWALVVLLLVLGTSCDGDSGQSSRSSTTVPSSTSSTTVLDVSVVPDVVTVEYLDAVIDRLDVLVGDAFRELVRDRGPNARFLALLDAVYDEPELEDKQSLYGEIAGDGFENVRDDPGDPVTTIERIIKNEPGCVIVAADRTFASWFREPHEGGQAFLAFTPKSPASDAGSLTPTALSVIFGGGTLDDVEPIDAC